MAKGSAKEVKSTLATRIVTPNSRWEDKDEFLDVVYWGRQITAVIMGLIWGYLGIVGVYGILSFIAANSALVFLYHNNFNDDQEDIMTSLKEGFMSMFASFLVTWILTYTYLFHNY